MTPEEKRRLELAYNAGRDSVENGANDTNCHFSLFATPELTMAWERGRDEARLKPRLFDVGPYKYPD